MHYRSWNTIVCRIVSYFSECLLSAVSLQSIHLNNNITDLHFFSVGDSYIAVTYLWTKKNLLVKDLGYHKLLVFSTPLVRTYISRVSHDSHMTFAGIGMMGQAIMSTAYHMCPSRYNFKFDATFINIQLGIGIHKLLQSRNPDKKPNLHYIMLFLAYLMLTIVLGTVSICTNC